MSRHALLATSFAALLLARNCQAFAPHPHPAHVPQTITTTQRSMGLMDFFSEDARKEREARREREIEEQERLQRQILERRRNPDKMDEYEARVSVRRAAIMAGQDGSKIKVMVDDDEEDETKAN